MDFDVEPSNLMRERDFCETLQLKEKGGQLLFDEDDILKIAERITTYLTLDRVVSVKQYFCIADQAPADIAYGLPCNWKRF